MQNLLQLLSLNTVDQDGLASTLLTAFEGDSRFRQVKEFCQVGDDRLVGLAVNRRRGQSQFQHVALYARYAVGCGPGLDMQPQYNRTVGK